MKEKFVANFIIRHLHNYKLIISFADKFSLQILIFCDTNSNVTNIPAGCTLLELLAFLWFEVLHSLVGILYWNLESFQSRLNLKLDWGF